MLDSAPIPQLITVTETEPVWHPVTDVEFKRYARIDDAVNENPDLLNQLIHAATQIVESYMGTVFHRRTFVQRQTGGVEYIPAMRTPVTTVSSITYAESFESSYVTVSTSSYRVGGNDFYHKDGYFTAGRPADGYVITYTAGMVADATPSTISTDLKTAVLRVAAFLYENRQEYATGWSEQGFSISYDVLKGVIGRIVNHSASARGVF